MKNATWEFGFELWARRKSHIQYFLASCSMNNKTSQSRWLGQTRTLLHARTSRWQQHLSWQKMWIEHRSRQILGLENDSAILIKVSSCCSLQGRGFGRLLTINHGYHNQHERCNSHCWKGMIVVEYSPAKLLYLLFSKTSSGFRRHY